MLSDPRPELAALVWQPREMYRAPEQDTVEHSCRLEDLFRIYFALVQSLAQQMTYRAVLYFESEAVVRDLMIVPLCRGKTDRHPQLCNLFMRYLSLAFCLQLECGVLSIQMTVASHYVGKPRERLANWKRRSNDHKANVSKYLSWKHRNGISVGGAGVGKAERRFRDCLTTQQSSLTMVRGR